MYQKIYWQGLHQKYSQQEWSKHPNIFANEVVKYFPKSGKVLDLAAGLGQDSKYFTNLGYDVTTTDLVPPFQVVDLSQRLPFSDNSFDIVYSHLGLHYFTYSRSLSLSLFQEIYNVLKTGGLFCALFNSSTDPETSRLQKIDTDFYQTEEGITKRFFSPESLKQMLPQEFKILLLDDNGKTIKDGDGRLIRLVCQK